MGFLDYDGLLHFWLSIKPKFADATHTHAIADTTGLQAALDGKASTGTATTDAAGLMSAADKSKLDGIAEGADKSDAYTKAEVDERLTGYLKSADAEATYAPKSHKHAMADVTGLQAALDAKASTGTATTDAAGLMSAADKSKLDGIGAATASEVYALGTRMDDAESSIAELAKRLPIYYYTDVPSESSITDKPQLAVIKGGAVYLVE